MQCTFKDYTNKKKKREKSWERGLEVREREHECHITVHSGKIHKEEFCAKLSTEHTELGVSSLYRTFRLTGDFTGVKSGCTSNNWAAQSL